MTPPRRRGRRVPPKGTGPRPVPPPLAGSGSGDSSSAGTGGSGAGSAGGAGMSPAEASAERARQLTRSQNRAAKRAASGVRPKAVRGGRVTGRRNRGYNPFILALAIAAVLVGAVILLIGNPFGGPTPSASPGASGAVASHGDGTCPTSQPASLAAGQVKTVTIQTSKGTIVLRIDGSLAPIATGNFVALVACHFYDGIVFHRLVPGFVIQGGDPQGTGGGGPGYTIKDDPLNGTYHRGTVAMARTGQPDSEGSQFFIVLSDDANAALTNPSNAPYPYAIMGEVTSGMDVVDLIAALPNSGDGSGNQALDPVVMTSVTVADAPAASASPAATSASPAATGASPAASQ